MRPTQHGRHLTPDRGGGEGGGAGPHVPSMHPSWHEAESEPLHKAGRQANATSLQAIAAFHDVSAGEAPCREGGVVV